MKMGYFGYVAAFVRRSFRPDGGVRRLFVRLLLPAVAAAAGCHNGPFDMLPPDAPEPPATISLAELHRRCADGTVTVTNPLAVSGIVTTTDLESVFYHTLCIESEGAALEVLAGIEHLHVDYPPGCRVVVPLEGLCLHTYRGVLQAGVPAAPGSYSPVDYLASPAAVAERLIRTGDPLQEVVATRRSAAELTPALCGTLVTLDGLQPDEILPENDLPRWGGTHRFRDAAGNYVYSYVREGARFAGTTLPKTPCSLTGILRYDSGTERYLIQLRDASDIHY